MVSRAVISVSSRSWWSFLVLKLSYFLLLSSLTLGALSTPLWRPDSTCNVAPSSKELQSSCCHQAYWEIFLDYAAHSPQLTPQETLCKTSESHLVSIDSHRAQAHWELRYVSKSIEWDSWLLPIIFADHSLSISVSLLHFHQPFQNP